MIFGSSEQVHRDEPLVGCLVGEARQWEKTAVG